MSMQTKCNVLVIETEKTTKKSLLAGLHRLGCMVTIADSVEGAMGLMCTERYDAVFSGVCVGENTGRELATWSRDKGLSTAFFLITAWGAEIEPHFFRLHGVSAVIRTPINWAELSCKLILAVPLQTAG